MVKCCLCKKETEEKSEFHIGGCITYAHKSCVKIVENYIDRLENYEKIAKREVGVGSSKLKKSMDDVKRGN